MVEHVVRILEKVTNFDFAPNNYIYLEVYTSFFKKPILWISYDHCISWNHWCTMHLFKQFACLPYISKFLIHVIKVFKFIIFDTKPFSNTLLCMSIPSSWSPMVENVKRLQAKVLWSSFTHDNFICLKFFRVLSENLLYTYLMSIAIHEIMVSSCIL